MTTPRHEDSLLPLSSLAAVPAEKNLASTTLMQRHAVLVEFVYTVVSDVRMKHVSRILCNAFVAPVVSLEDDRVILVEGGKDEALVSAHVVIVALTRLMRICACTSVYMCR
jgi:hypothetical protein